MVRSSFAICASRSALFIFGAAAMFLAGATRRDAMVLRAAFTAGRRGTGARVFRLARSAETGMALFLEPFGRPGRLVEGEVERIFVAVALRLVVGERAI